MSWFTSRWFSYQNPYSHFKEYKNVPPNTVKLTDELIKHMALSKPHVLRSDDIVYCDVDETLILWKGNTEDKKITVKDPYMNKVELIVYPHQRNIDLLKRQYGQGKKLIVWSAGGHAWAETIVKALGLDQYISLILTKPTVYIDDIPMKDWGTSRVYLNKDLPDPKKHKEKKLRGVI